MEKVRLNSQQKSAITYQKGPMIVVAGAGTGKTTVIVEKIRYLLTHKLAKPSEILTLTYTEKASQEMLNRVDTLMPIGYEEPWLSTFHSFCDRILRNEALEIGLDPSYKILTESRQWLLIRKHLFEFDLDYYRPLGNPTKFISALLQLFSRAKDEGVTADEFLEYAKNKDTAYGIRHTVINKKDNRKPLPADLSAETMVKAEVSTKAGYTVNRTPSTDAAELEDKEKLLELTHAYKKYQEILLSENCLDFGDLLLWTIQLFKKHPSVLLKYQKQFRYILIDEFQDTNFAQFEIIKLLAPARNNPRLTVVGDDDQAIYKFRGASLANILEFKKHYPKAKIIALTKNYRSTQNILDSAYNLIQNNNPDRLEIKLKINKHLSSVKKIKGDFPTVSTLETVEQEADFVSQTILENTENNKYSYSDFAVLARANNHLDPFVASLKRNGIPYSLIGNRGLFDQEEIRGITAFIKFITNHEDNVALYQMLLSPIFNFSDKELTDIISLSRKNKITVFQSINNQNTDTSKKFLKLIDTLKLEMHRKTATRLIYEFLTQSGYMKQLSREETMESALKIKNVNLFFNKIKEFESATDNPNIIEFADYLSLLTEAGENPSQAEIEDIDTVKLLTVHSAKGLEFPVVFLINMVSDRFPTRQRGDVLPFPEDLIKEKLPGGDFHLAEERRLCYVAVTRAKKKIFITLAKNYGGLREKKPSGFIHELNLHDLVLGTRYAKHNIKSHILNPNDTIDRKPHTVYRTPSSNNLPLPQNNKIKNISYSQLETYKTCPLKYQYKYIIGVTGLPGHALNFGQAIHRTLRDFHLYEMHDKTQSRKQMIKSYTNHFTELAQGYTSIEHREKTFAYGQEVLKKYFDRHVGLFGKPLFLEQQFTLRINDIFLKGSIDRIDELKDKTLEVIDYKTGSSGENQKDIDKDSQLTIYALACQETLGLKPKIYSLYFIEKDVKLSTTRSDKQISDQKEEIINTVGEIDKGIFKPKTGPWCKWCEFNNICPAYKIGQNVF